MKLLFILDPLEELKAYKDTSVAMMRAAQSRGHQVYFCEQSDLHSRGRVMARNQEPFSAWTDFWRHVVKLVCLGDAAFIATVRTARGCPAAFFGVEFGDALYYVAGGTERNDHGYGSFMFMTLIERWFTAHPTGRLYLGRQSACVDPSEYTRGNQLYRRKLRAQSMPGTAFVFRLAHVTSERLLRSSSTSTTASASS